MNELIAVPDFSHEYHGPFADEVAELEQKRTADEQAAVNAWSVDFEGVDEREAMDAFNEHNLTWVDGMLLDGLLDGCVEPTPTEYAEMEAEAPYFKAVAELFAREVELVIGESEPTEFLKNAAELLAKSPYLGFSDILGGNLPAAMVSCQYEDPAMVYGYHRGKIRVKPLQQSYAQGIEYLRALKEDIARRVPEKADENLDRLYKAQLILQEQQPQLPEQGSEGEY